MQNQVKVHYDVAILIAFIAGITSGMRYQRYAKCFGSFLALFFVFFSYSWISFINLTLGTKAKVAISQLFCIR